MCYIAVRGKGFGKFTSVVEFCNVVPEVMDA